LALQLFLRPLVTLVCCYSCAMSNSPKYANVEDTDEELKINGGQFDKKIAVGQVTIRLPIDPNPLNILALAYGFLPWLIPLGLGVEFLLTWHFVYAYGVCISVFLAIINEGILKRIFKDPRPRQSANKNADGTMKHGMPSGHVLNSTSLMIWSALEVYLQGPGLHKHQQLTFCWLSAIFAAMFPVPWARVYNMDHSMKQCGVSMFIGAFVGVGAFYLRVHYFNDAWKPWTNIKDLHDHVPIVTFWRPPWVSTTAAPTLLL